MVEIDESRDSLIVVRFASALSDAELEQYLSRYEAWARSQPRFAALICAEEGTRLLQHQRARQAEWLKEHAALLRERSVGTAFVLPGPSTRFLLSTILMLVPMPTPYRVFRSEGDGLAWVEERLGTADAALGVPGA